MSLLPFLAITLGAATLALLSRRRPRLSLVVGLTGLALALFAALAIRSGEAIEIGGGTIVTTAYGRLFLVLGAASGLAISVIGLATSWQRNVPAATLASLGWTGLALALPDPPSALGATIAAGLTGILVTLVAPLDERGVEVGARELRAVAVGGTLALVALAGLAGGLSLSGTGAGTVGLAYLAVVVAVALRFGTIPFHAWAGRLSQSAPGAALPLLQAWLPAGFALVALAALGGPPGAAGAVDGAPAGLLAGSAEALALERGLVVALGAIGLLFGTFAAWIQDDLEHLVGYSIAQDAAFVILALAAPGPEAWAPARSWILVFALAKTGLAAWALVLGTTYGSRRIDRLVGWARRSPVLAIAFVLLVLATIGWPGSTAWAARTDLVHAAVGDPLRTFVVLAGLSSLLYYARLAGIGLRRPADELGGRTIPRLRWRGSLQPTPDAPDRAAAMTDAPPPAARPAEGAGNRETPLAPDRTAGTSGTWKPALVVARLAGALRGARIRAGELAARFDREWHGRRAMLASLLVLVLAGAAVLSAAGWPEIPAAAGEPPPAATTGPGSP
jgi:hypothetical protein